MKKLLTAILISAVIVAFLTGLMIYKAEGYKEQASQLKARNNMLEISLIEKDKIIKAQKNTITGLNQQVEQLTISNTANEMYIQDLESATLHMATYISYVNLTLRDSGIEIPKWILGYVDENGKVVKQ